MIIERIDDEWLLIEAARMAAEASSRQARLGVARHGVARSGMAR